MKRPCKRLTKMRFLSSTVTYKFSNLTVNIEIKNIINYSSHPPYRNDTCSFDFCNFLYSSSLSDMFTVILFCRKMSYHQLNLKYPNMSTRSYTLKTLIHLNHKNRLGDFTIGMTLLTAFLCLFSSKFCVIAASIRSGHVECFK